MPFKPETPYHPIPRGQPEATFGAVVEILLKTRLKLRLTPQPDRNDEDVNAYMAGVLVSYIDPAYLAALQGWVSEYDIDVFRAADAADDSRAYWIYKVNADDLLVGLGIFHGFWQEERGEVTRLRRYYTHASEYQRKIYRRPTAVARIQEKLSAGPERYLAILSSARSEYFHFYDRVRQEDLREFKSRLEAHAGTLPVKAQQDELLDAYSQWLHDQKSPERRRLLRQKIEALSAIDPDFRPESILNQLRQAEAA